MARAEARRASNRTNVDLLLARLFHGTIVGHSRDVGAFHVLPQAPNSAVSFSPSSPQSFTGTHHHLYRSTQSTTPTINTRIRRHRRSSASLQPSSMTTNIAVCLGSAQVPPSPVALVRRAPARLPTDGWLTAACGPSLPAPLPPAGQGAATCSHAAKPVSSWRRTLPPPRHTHALDHHPVA